MHRLTGFFHPGETTNTTASLLDELNISTEEGVTGPVVVSSYPLCPYQLHTCKNDASSMTPCVLDFLPKSRGSSPSQAQALGAYGSKLRLEIRTSLGGLGQAQ